MSKKKLDREKSEQLTGGIAFYITYLLFCFKSVWVNFVNKIGLCADIVVTFVFDEAHISIVCGLYKGKVALLNKIAFCFGVLEFHEIK